MLVDVRRVYEEDVVLKEGLVMCVSVILRCDRTAALSVCCNLSTSRQETEQRIALRLMKMSRRWSPW